MRAFLNQLYRLMHVPDAPPFDLNRLGGIEASDIAAALYATHLKHAPGPADQARIAALRPRIQREIAEGRRGRVLVKTHNARIEDRGSPTINARVTSGAIYLVRNPLDVAISFAAFRGISLDRAIADMAVPGFGNSTNARTVYWVSGSWSENVRSWTATPDPTILVLRYEDILADPAARFAEAARHILLAPTADQVAEAVGLSSFDRLRGIEKTSGFSERPVTAREFFRKGSAGQWRAALSDAQVERIVADHGEQMARFGYMPA
jgi:hypothetical protein